MGQPGIRLHQAVQLLPLGVLHLFFGSAHMELHIQNMLFDLEQRVIDGERAVQLLMLGQIADGPAP